MQGVKIHVHVNLVCEWVLIVCEWVLIVCEWVLIVCEWVLIVCEWVLIVCEWVLIVYPGCQDSCESSRVSISHEGSRLSIWHNSFACAQTQTSIASREWRAGDVSHVRHQHICQDTFRHVQRHIETCAKTHLDIYNDTFRHVQRHVQRHI